MGLSLKKIGKSLGKVLKPVEKLARPLVKTVASVVPGGSAVLAAHKAAKSVLYDPLRRGGQESANLVEKIQATVEDRVELARKANAAADRVDDTRGYLDRNKWVVPVIGAGGVALFLLGGRR